MNNTSDFGGLALDRLKELKVKQQSAERVSSIELPSDVAKLITGSDYWVKAKTNRYKMLIKQGHLQELLDLAEMAHGKDNPANWFARVASVKMWERTLAFLAKCRKVMQTAGEVATRLGTSVSGFIVKQVWQQSKALQYAIQAQELATNKLKYFAWLCTHSEAL